MKRSIELQLQSPNMEMLNFRSNAKNLHLIRHTRNNFVKFFLEKIQQRRLIDLNRNIRWN